MIVSRRLDPLLLVRSVGLPLLLLLIYDVTITILYGPLGQTWLEVDNLPLGLLGSALAIIIGLRNNTAYGRWWEARTLWGSAVNNSRSLVRGALVFLPHDRVRVLVYLQIAWAHALRGALRKQDTWPEVAAFLSHDAAARVRSATNLPAAIQGEMARHLARCHDGSTDASVRLASIDRTLSALADAQGGLERINNTPMPRQFEQFPRVFVAIYSLLLPIGLLHDLGMLTPIGSTVISAAFYLIDQIGRDLQDPFVGSVHDVAVAAITRTIEVDLRQILGEQDTPKALQPVDGVLE